MIPAGNLWEMAWSTVTSLILKGIDGNDEDIMRSCSLAGACLESCDDKDRCSTFLVTIMRKCIQQITSITRTIHPGLSLCSRYFQTLSEDQVHLFLWNLLQKITTEAKPYEIVNILDIFMQLLSSFSSFFITFAPRLLFQLTTTIAQLNYDCFVHARSLRLFAELLPLIELMPVHGEESWLQQQFDQEKDRLEEEKQVFLNSLHRR